MSMVMLHSPQIMYLTRDIKTSCTLLGTVAIYQRPVVAGGGFFLLLDLGLGAAACEMGIEINTGYSCYLSAARRRQSYEKTMGGFNCFLWEQINCGRLI